MRKDWRDPRMTVTRRVRDPLTGKEEYVEFPPERAQFLSTRVLEQRFVRQRPDLEDPSYHWRRKK
jgi:hypothetical protein